MKIHFGKALNGKAMIEWLRKPATMYIALEVWEFRSSLIAHSQVRIKQLYQFTASLLHSCNVALQLKVVSKHNIILELLCASKT